MPRRAPVRPHEAVVVGAGAVGSFLGGTLAAAGWDVTLLGRRGSGDGTSPQLVIDGAGGRRTAPVRRIAEGGGRAVVSRPRDPRRQGIRPPGRARGRGSLARCPGDDRPERCRCRGRGRGRTRIGADRRLAHDGGGVDRGGRRSTPDRRHRPGARPRRHGRAAPRARGRLRRRRPADHALPRRRRDEVVQAAREPGRQRDERTARHGPGRHLGRSRQASTSSGGSCARRWT